nr:hypothetical protein [Cecembia calidifontis]
MELVIIMSQVEAVVVGPELQEILQEVLLEGEMVEQVEHLLLPIIYLQ